MCVCACLSSCITQVWVGSLHRTCWFESKSRSGVAVEVEVGVGVEVKVDAETEV